ncbi:hypothetical protein L1987_17443 [Smallanthus sonchifolius]|uniref:Uncharacterized protein n=1 Tax=Smallanthus sonchifolius TaxID=185202 RepID=A0ACB9IZ54_9ASTR|nr:hypothetical protein L1987_17443 [Smallanthus sonchifolius]
MIDILENLRWLCLTKLAESGIIVHVLTRIEQDHFACGYDAWLRYENSRQRRMGQGNPRINGGNTNVIAGIRVNDNTNQGGNERTEVVEKTCSFKRISSTSSRCTQ